MSIENILYERSGSKCELCTKEENLQIYDVPPTSEGSADTSILICDTCVELIESPEKKDVHHWHCLNESMWSETPAVKVLAWRILKRLDSESWAQELFDMLYLDEETLKWAMAVSDSEQSKTSVIHRDNNGAELSAGDTVTLIKDLNVKGGGFTAKRGTAVRNISLVVDNAEHIEGRVSGQQIVILTKYVKKAN